MANKKKDQPLNAFKDGEWQVSNLKFLADFFKKTGLSTENAAEKVGITRQAVYYWFATDDAKISTIMNFIDKCGYTIDFSIVREDMLRGNAWVKIDVDPKEEQNIHEGRLAFLDRAMKQNGLSKKTLARKIGLGESAIFYWFTKDDCMISHVYRIAEAEGLQVKIHIQPKQ